LAPEYPYPAGLEDCYRVADVMLDNLSLIGLTDASQLILIGDSAGGNLAAAVSLFVTRTTEKIIHSNKFCFILLHSGITQRIHRMNLFEQKGPEYGLNCKKSKANI